MNLWLLFLIAIAAGYGIGRLDRRRRQKQKITKLASEYSKGINFLLNEQPDQAIEVLTESLAVSENTLETHLALGRLFRRRGELDRATRIHQNLLESTEAGSPLYDEVLFELGQDYLAAGVFDRAEQYFSVLSKKHDRFQAKALRALLQIYEQEKDWHSALAAGDALRKSSPDIAPVLAHYCCQMAERQLGTDNDRPARRLLKRALDYDKQSARAWMLLARLEARQGDSKAALSAYLSLFSIDAALFDDVLDEVETVYRHQRGETEWLRFLADSCVSSPSTNRVLRLASGLEKHYGEEEASKLLAAYMDENPSIQGLHQFIDLAKQGEEDSLRESLLHLSRMAKKLPSEHAHYLCRQCGYISSQLYWHCPSCKQWGTIRPKATAHSSFVVAK